MTLDQISIGKYSLMTRLTRKALRLYDQKEILVPEEKDDLTGYRYYSVRQIEDGIRIKLLASMGFPLSDIKLILNAFQNNQNAIIKKIFQNRLNETQLEIQRLKRIEHVLVNKENIMDLLKMNVSTPIVKKSGSLRILSKFARGTYGQTIGELINEIMGEIYSPDNRRNFVKIVGPIMFICHDDEYKAEDAQIEVAIPISGRVQLNNDEIEVKNLPETRVVSVMFTGAYDNIGNGYKQLFDFIEENRFKIAGHTRELYLNSPEQVSEEELLTEIQVPIENSEED